MQSPHCLAPSFIHAIISPISPTWSARGSPLCPPAPREWRREGESGREQCSPASGKPVAPRNPWEWLQPSAAIAHNPVNRSLIATPLHATCGRDDTACAWPCMTTGTLEAHQWRAECSSNGHSCVPPILSQRSSGHAERAVEIARLGDITQRFALILCGPAHSLVNYCFSAWEP